MTDDAAPQPPAAAPDLPPAKPRRTWRRRLLRLAVAMVVLLVAVRALFGLLLPTAINRAAGLYGLAVTYERSELNLLSGDVGLWHLTVSPKPAPSHPPDASAEPLARVAYVRGNISLLALLRLNLEVWRAEADGAEISVERLPDGRIPLLERVLAALPAADPAAAAKAPDPAGPRTPLSLASPIKIDALRLSHATIKLRDRAVTPEFTAALGVDFRLSDVGSAVRPVTMEVTLWSDPGLDLLRLQGVGKGEADKLEADFRVTMRGLTLEPLAAYLRPLGLQPAGGAIAGWADMQVRLARGAAPDVDTVAGQINFARAALSTAGRPFAEMDKVTIDLKGIGADAARVARVLADGGRVTFGRTGQGRLAFGGMELVGAPPSPPAARPAAAAVARTATPSAAPAAAPAPVGKPYLWSLDEFRVTNSSAAFADEAVAPALRVEATLAELAVRNLICDPANRDAAAQIAATAAVPGVIGQTLVTGSFAPFADAMPLRLSLRAAEIRPDLLKPYLDQLKVESLLAGAELSADVTAGRRRAADGGPPLFDAAITDVKYQDGGEPLLSFPKIAVAGFRVQPVPSRPDALPRISVESIDLVGPDVPVRRDADGLLVIAGSRRTPQQFAQRVGSAVETVAAASTQPAADAAAGIVVNVPPVRIDRLDWSGIRVAWSDASTRPPTQLGVSDAGLRIENLDIDLTPQATGAVAATTRPAAPGTIKGWIAAPGIAERVTLDGTIASGQGSLTLAVAVAGQGITGGAVRPYLSPVGITPILEDGRLRARAVVNLSQHADDVLRGSLAAGDVAWADGDRELAAVDAVRVDGIEFGARELRVGAVAIDRPRAALVRAADGALVGGGIRLQLPDTPAGRPAVAATTRPAAPATLVPLPFAIHLKSLAVTGAALTWSDAAASPQAPVELSLSADATLTGLVVAEESRGAPPAQFQAALRLPEVMETLSAQGTIDAGPRSLAVSLTSKGSGINAAALAPYFPRGIEPTLRDGSFAATLDAAVGLADGGGYAVRTQVRDVRYADGERVLAEVGSAKFDAQRIDFAGGVIAVKEVSSSGVRAHVDLLEGYAPSLLGVALRPTGAATAEPIAAATQPSPVVELAAESGNAAPDPAAMVAAARRPMALFTLESLDLRLDNLTINNRADPAAAPAVLSDVRLANLSPVVWGGKNANETPPAKFRATAKVAPLVESITAEASLAPFVDDPRARLLVAADGIRGAGLTDLVPALAELIDGQRLTDGRFTLNADLQLRPDRRGGVPDYRRGFGADLTVRDTSFRNGPDGPVLAGVEQVQASGVRVEPGSGNVTVRSLEITTPSAYVVRDQHGVEALGLLVKIFPTGEAATQQSPTETAAAPPEPAPAAADTAAPPPSTQPAVATGPEYRVDRVNWSGLDLRIEDRTVEPPLLLPINGFDLEATGLSNRVLTEGRPVRFAMLVTAGKVPLPKRTGGGGIAGAIGDLGAMLGGKKDQLATAPATEDREMFAQVAAAGRVSLYPKPAGYVKLGVSGLELASIRGFAQSAGVTLDGGVFDTTVDVRARPTGEIDARTRLILTDLQMSEPANGPIVRHLKLPAPLDAVIAAVQDADGSITLPINVPIKQGELQTGAVVGSAVGALGQVLATAVASTPVKAVTGVGAIIGIGGKDKKPAEPHVVSIDFAPGDASVSAAEMGKVRALLQVLKGQKDAEVTLRHELSPADVARAASRANPPPADAAAIAQQLRARRAGLIADRAATAARAESQLSVAADPRKPAPALDELRQLDRQIARTDAAMEAMFEQLRPGADRQAPRRTRTAAIDVGRQRLDVVRGLLAPPEAGPAAAERVRAAAAGFNLAESASADAGGRVIVTVIQRKK